MILYLQHSALIFERKKSCPAKRQPLIYVLAAASHFSHGNKSNTITTRISGFLFFCGLANIFTWKQALIMYTCLRLDTQESLPAGFALGWVPDGISKNQQPRRERTGLVWLISRSAE
jgi:hypothetical protein